MTIEQLLNEVEAGAAARLPEILMRVLHPMPAPVAPERRLMYALHCVRHRQLLGPYVRAKAVFSHARRLREMHLGMTDLAFARVAEELAYRDELYHKTPCKCSPTRR